MERVMKGEYLIVLNKDEDTLSLVTLASNEVVKTIPSDHNPHEVVVSPDGLKTYVTCSLGNTIDVIDNGSFEIIDRVVYQKDMVSLVSDNVTRISYVLLGLAAILLFISIALINNTIRMSLYSNRFLINTMKLVGATPGFIRKPYMIKTMINSLIASVIAIGLLVGVVAYVQVQFAIPDVLIQSTNLIIVAVAVVLLGLLLSVVSSWISVGRYLRMTSNDLHII